MRYMMAFSVWTMTSVFNVLLTVLLSLAQERSSSVHEEVLITYGNAHEVTEYFLHICYASVTSVVTVLERGNTCMINNLYFMILNDITEQISPQPSSVLHPPLYGQIWCTSKMPWIQSWQLQTTTFLAINATFLYFNLPIFTALCPSVNVTANGLDTEAIISNVWCGRKRPWSIYTARDKHILDVLFQSIYGLPLEMGFALEYIAMDKQIQESKHMEKYHTAHMILLNLSKILHWKTYCIKCSRLYSLHIVVLPYEQACIRFNFILLKENMDENKLHFYDGPGIQTKREN